LRLCGAAKVRYCLVVSTKKYLMVGWFHSLLFYEFWDLPVSASEKRVNLASDKLQAGLLAQLLGGVRDPSNSSTVSSPSSKAMSDRCIHVVFSLFLDSRRLGLPHIQISESDPEQDLISALCPPLHNQVPHKVNVFLNFCKVGNHMKFRDFGRRKAPWESVSRIWIITSK
jgi:hypothetical protein